MAAISTDWDAEFMTWGVGLGLTTLYNRDKIDKVVYQCLRHHQTDSGGF